MVLCGIGPPQLEIPVQNLRAALSVVVLVLSAISVSAASCPTVAPAPYPYGYPIAYAGENCASQLGVSPCSPGQPVAFTLSSYYYSFQSCDVVTWQYGDGTSESAAPGILTANHTYAATGTYSVRATVTNSLGTVTTDPRSVAVAVGLITIPYPYYGYGQVQEGAVASFPITRANTAGTTTVHFETVDGSALAGQQYVATSGDVTFAAGQSQQTISVPTIDDHVYRGQTSFTVHLTSASGGFAIDPSTPSAFFTIQDVDRPILSFETAAYVVQENAGSINVNVLRSNDTASVVSFRFNVGNSSCCSTIQTGIITMLAGETAKWINVTIPHDDAYNGDQDLYVSLQSINGIAIVPQTPAHIAVKEDTPEPVVTFQSVTVPEGNAGSKSVDVSVTLSQKCTFDVYVTAIASKGNARQFVDFNLQNSFVRIPAGTLSAALQVIVPGNATVDVNRTFAISGTTSRSCCSTLNLQRVEGIFTILNDDATVTPGRLSISRDGTGSVIANFGSAPVTPQTLLLSSSDPSVASVPSSLIVTSGYEVVPVTANSVGQATITTTLPAAYGGGVFTTSVNVYDGAVMVLSPASVSLPVGGTATISASMAPALTAPEGATLKTSGTGAITAPTFISVDPGATATFTITGVRKGTVELVATLGANRGNAATGITIDVIDPLTTPSITQVSPANGPAAGGTNVTVNGANLRADCTIRFGGVPALNTAFVSASAMTATTPEHAAGAVDVALSCGADSFNYASGFTYLAGAATLSAVSPSFGTTAGNTVVTITGTKIPSGCWPFFGGIPARAAIVNGPTEMIASTPAHPEAGTVPLLVRCTGATDVSLANAFTYSSAAESAPVITGVDPLVGSAGKTITISGARFRYDDTVTFDTTIATTLTTSPGTHVVRVPELPLGRVSITVTEPGGRSSTTGPIVTIVEPQPPQITAVSPTTTRPGNELALDGSGFRPGYSFAIGDEPATLISLTYTRVVVRVPQLGAGSYDVNILNAASKIAAIGPKVTVQAGGLAITRVAPGCITTEGGVRMTINGTGFVSGAVVTFDGAVAAGATVSDAQTITLTVPPLPAGMPRILVTNPNGDSASLSNAFIVHSPFDPNGCSSRFRPARH